MSTHSKPDYNVSVTEEVQGKTYWHRVGVAWKHKEKDGLNIHLHPGISVSGKLVLTTPKQQDSSNEGAGA